MARLFVGLKLRLLVGGWRQQTARFLGFLASLLVFTPLAVLAAVGLTVLGRRVDGGAQLVTLPVLVLPLAWAAYPLVAFGLEETLDPARLALYPLTGRQLSAGPCCWSPVRRTAPRWPGRAGSSRPARCSAPAGGARPVGPGLRPRPYSPAHPAPAAPPPPAYRSC